ncbi:hypothetical protein G9C98_003768 [Cotesia typhae]|uniref:Uncharacterized protein n=1 Tax=Cotesia typhae TaxID=2053667 RepID=A0A8J5QRA7_9HYME|nr:hypothetical protein G9C98_003768 [Cotesia typhae]
MQPQQQLRSKLSNGIPELDAPAIEPLVLKHVRLLRGPEGARLDVNLTNIQVKGPSTFKIREFKADVDDVTFTFKVSFGLLSFRGKYEINARLLLLRLSGNGDITGNFSPVSNQILNANSNLLIDELKPVLESALSDLFTDVANKITNSFKYSELFPDD